MEATPTKIYVVDDDESVRLSLVQLMRSAGYESVGFSNANEFLTSEVSDENSCVVSDLRMAGGSGFSIPAKLVELGLSIPLIIVTAHDTDDMRAEARALGVAAYFRKPVDDQALIDAIEWALEKCN